MGEIDISSGSNVMTFSLFSSRMVLSSSTAKLVVKLTFLATGTVVIGSIVHFQEIVYIVIGNDLTLRVVSRYLTKVSTQKKKISYVERCCNNTRHSVTLSIFWTSN